jgi:hypothetical protein
MDFKLPIYCMGITQDAENVTRIAILQKTCKGWRLCCCDKLTEEVALSLPKRFLSAKVVLSLQGQETLVKSVLSSLKSKNNFLKVVYAEQEATAAFPLQELVIAHHLGGWNSDQERALTLWMLQRQSIATQTALLEEKGMFATHISCRAKDIFSALQHTLLNRLASYFFVYEGIDETTCLFVREGSVLLARSFKNDSEGLLEDLLASFAYVQEVYKIRLSEIHGAYLSSSLRTVLSWQAGVPVIISPLFPHLSADQDSYRDAVAAAYQGIRSSKTCFTYSWADFSQKAFGHWIKRKLFGFTKLAMVSALLMFIGSGVESFFLVRQAQRMFREISSEKKLPCTLGSAQQAVKEICESDPAREYAYLPTVPTNQEVMDVLGRMTANLPSISFSHYMYKLEDIPSEERPLGGYKAYISLQGSANEEEFSSFIDKLSAWLGAQVLSKKLANSQFDVRMVLLGRE